MRALLTRPWFGTPAPQYARASVGRQRRVPFARREFRAPSLFVILGAFIASTFGASIAHAAQPAPAGAAPALASKPAPARDPATALGDRVRAITHARAVAPVVVIVGSPAEYCAAIEAWRAGLIFPVLIDDSTSQSAEAIGRFVRAFEPASVVRYAPPPGEPARLDPSEIAARVQAVAARAIAPDEPATPPGAAPAPIPAGALGVVVYDPSDSAWPAALALASAHGQTPIATSIPLRPDGLLTLDEVRTLQKSIIDGAAKAGNRELRVDRPAPDIAITLCTNTSSGVVTEQADLATLRVPPQLKAKPGEALALTDVLGRELAGPRAGRAFACVGQIGGSLRQSAERAMCAIFLPPRVKSAWLFESYAGGPPWSTYSASDAAKVLRDAGIPSALAGVGGAGRTLDAWHALARSALDVDLVLMNSSGLLYSFDLEGAVGAARAAGTSSDVPFARRPMIVHMIHSWSAQRPGNRFTIGGRWIDRGAYAYVGSVHEPFLSAFVPTPEVARRLSIGLPLGLAARHANISAWRVTLLGDPLITLARPGAKPRIINEPIALKTSDVQESVAADLKAERFDSAIRSLIMLGRDEGVSKLAGAMLREHRDKITPALATGALLAAHRAGDSELIADLFPKTIDAKAPKSDDDRAIDALWQSLLPLRSKLTDKQLDVLAANPRPGLLVRDAKSAAELISIRRGRPAAAAYVATLRSRAGDDTARKELEALEKSYLGR